ncbi:hypothetical protein NR798_00010 [Archangium gephyra]|uniref:hypothetical protein n=1 Tax=Archangium gephyra TaxID=48 RepID=UPI0035D4DD21
MERSTSVPTGMGEQSLTPGEQRILALMEQGQQRLEEQLKDLSLRAEQEAAASKTRDRELAAELQHSRDQAQERNLWMAGEIKRTQQSTLEAMYLEMNSMRAMLSKRLDQHDTRLGAVEGTLERHEEHMRRLGQTLQGLQQEMQKLAAAVERLAQAPHLAASP